MGMNRLTCVAEITMGGGMIGWMTYDHGSYGNFMSGEVDKATEKYGPKPTPQQIAEMAKYKGYTYQRSGNKDKGQTSAPKVPSTFPKSSEPINVDLNIDLGGWINNAKILVPVSEIMKIPSQREKLLKAVHEPPKTVIQKQPAIAYQDAPVILQNWDRSNSKNLPFYLSLLVNDKVLHNCMLDSGASSNVMTKKVMEQLNLRISRPYHNICALDSQTIEVFGLIKGLQVYLKAVYFKYTCKLFLLNQTKVSKEAEDAGQMDHENAILEVHRQYNLRSKKTEGNSSKKTTETQKVAEDEKNLEKTTAEKSPEKGRTDAPVKKNITILKRPAQPEVSHANLPSNSDQRNMGDQPEPTSQTRTPAPFSLEAELAKIKIPVPLTELIRRGGYRSQVLKALAIEPDIGTRALTIGSVTHSDTVNLADDRPELLFGPEVDGRDDTGDVAPFYISLNIHDLILHNAMLDSGASHNLMPKAVMEKLGLEVTRPYKDLHSFDSSKVKCIGLIKDLCITLVQIPSKSMVMDVVVADIPPKYGMLLSRSWGAKLKGTL
jgi:hypothetical protein